MGYRRHLEMYHICSIQENSKLYLDSIKSRYQFVKAAANAIEIECLQYADDRIQLLNRYQLTINKPRFHFFFFFFHRMRLVPSPVKRHNEGSKNKRISYLRLELPKKKIFFFGFDYIS